MPHRTEQRGLSVGLSVALSVCHTIVSPAKTAATISLRPLSMLLCLVAYDSL